MVFIHPNKIYSSVLLLLLQDELPAIHLLTLDLFSVKNTWFGAKVLFVLYFSEIVIVPLAAATLGVEPRELTNKASKSMSPCNTTLQYNMHLLLRTD